MTSTVHAPAGPRTLPVYLGPRYDAVIAEAIERSGGRLVPIEHAEAAVWTSLDPSTWLEQARPERVRWVQLLSAGIEKWIESGALEDGRVWTSARGASALTVAEHALALLLAVRRRLVECARADTWCATQGMPLRGSTVLIVGAGAIGRALIPMLSTLEVETIAVTRSGRRVEGARESHDPSALPALWPRADAVVLAAPATPSTRRIVDAAALAAMPSHAVVVNVARGSLVDTDALVAAVVAGGIAGAGLDVTDPEPLPRHHPLWSLPTVLVTPHSANPEIAWKVNVASRVSANVRRYLADEELVGRVDLLLSY